MSSQQSPPTMMPQNNATIACFPTG